MPDFLQSFDLGSSALLPLLALIAGLFLIKKLLRLGLLLALMGGAVLVLEHQGYNVVGSAQDALTGLKIGELYDWLLDGVKL